MTDEEVKSWFHVNFESSGSTKMDISMNEVTPLQLLALAGYLEYKGKNELQRMEMEAIQQAMQQEIAIPKPGIRKLDD